jgi:hypothetical protein
MGRRLSELQTEHQQTELLHDFYGEVTRLGITSIQNMCYPTSAQQLVPFLEKLPPPIRLRVIWFGLTGQHGRLAHESRGLPLHPVPLVTVSGTKWILDGTPIERGGAMRRLMRIAPILRVTWTSPRRKWKTCCANHCRTTIN